jgi:hypothetical protein
MSYTFPSLLPATVIPHFLAGEKIPLESVLFPCGVHYNNWTIPVLLGVLSVPETHHDGNRKKKRTGKFHMRFGPWGLSCH